MLQPRYFELILYKTYADLRTETEKTYIGFLWWVIDPIIFMAIFYVVFGLLLNRGTADFVAFLLIGLVAWRWFQNTVTHGANALVDNRNLMRQVYIPKIVFPLVTICTDFVKFCFVFVLLLVYLWLSGYPVNVSYLALPMLLITQLLLILATTCFVAAVVPFFPDLRIFVQHIMQAAFFLSGIFFSSEKIPEAYRVYFYANPMANLIEAYRDILLHGRWPSLSALTIIGLSSLIAFIGAHRLLMRYDYTYPKIAY